MEVGIVKNSVKSEKKSERAIWLAALMFSASVLFQGFDSDLGFYIAGGVGIVVSFLGYFLKWQP